MSNDIENMIPRRLRLAILALALATGTVLARSHGLTAVDATPAVETIKRLDQEFNAAVKARDTATVDRVLLSDFLLITSAARIRTKDDILKEIVSPELTMEINRSTDVTVRVYGDTAVLTGSLHQKGMQKGQPFDARMRYTDTWVRVDGAWRQLSGHASKVVEVK